MSNNMSFEDSLKRIEEIVSLLEKGEVSLDESLSLFEEATALCSKCNQKLEDAEKKVKAFTMLKPEIED